jgi:hypothetical protein
VQLAVNGLGEQRSVHPAPCLVTNAHAPAQGPPPDAHAAAAQAQAGGWTHGINVHAHKLHSEADEWATALQVGGGGGGGKRQRERERDSYVQTLMRLPSGCTAAVLQASDGNAGASGGAGLVVVGGQHGLGGKAGQAALQLQGFGLGSFHNITNSHNTQMKPGNAFKGSHLRQVRASDALPARARSCAA